MKEPEPMLILTQTVKATAVWSFVYTIERNPFTVPANGTATVACPALAVAPTPPVVLSNCGETLTPTGPAITNVPNPLTCEGTRTYAYTYTDCEGNFSTWNFVYTVERLPLQYLRMVPQQWHVRL
ncbi:MAG: hypothetical protein IPG18_12665 [Saprospiraceae bacterium]|nr:hypothetical protein [Saprospiraceae bacterium]